MLSRLHREVCIECASKQMTTPNEQPTPETDEKEKTAYVFFTHDYVVASSFARKLERERDKWKADSQRLTWVIENLSTYEFMCLPKSQSIARQEIDKAMNPPASESPG